MWKKVKWALALAGVPAVLVLWACLDDPRAPELSGPSELAASLEMRAIPDQLTADGWSSSVIEVVYRDENGQRTSGQTIQFDLLIRGATVFTDTGNIAPLNSPRPVLGGTEARAVSAVTDSNGMARIRYWAPFRTDHENDGVVTITARPAGTDFRAAVFRQVDIFLRAANRPTFPGTDGCSIIVEPQKPVYEEGEVIFFTAGQTSGVARYEWDLGDGSPRREGRNTEHAFDSGQYTVTLFQTLTSGEQNSSCTVGIAVQ